MTEDLSGRLERLGLSQYLEVLVAEGFDTWHTVLDITESDLNALNFKLGHRRKLQRAIAEYRGYPCDRGIALAYGKAGSIDGSYRSDDSGAEGSKTKRNEASIPTAGPIATKRKYRRHPKPDENAPERPPSAYVIFSNQMREELRGQDLSFTEIAKTVGEKWQVLPLAQREACERQANEAKERYYAELAEYKKTPQYAQYQAYLEDFKAKHAAPKQEGKRSRLENDSAAATRSHSHDNMEKAAASVRRVSVSTVDVHHVSERHRSGSSPPPKSFARPFPLSVASKPNSPATYSYSGVNSPRVAERYSPMSASPMSCSFKETYSEHPPRPSSGLMPESSNRPYESAPPHYASFSHSTPPPANYSGHYQIGIDLPSRRSYREVETLPSLNHEDTTLSSESTHSAPAGTQYQGSLLPVVDAPKSYRLLPQPVPTVGATPSLLNQRPLQAVSLTLQQHDSRPASSLAALLRAGELAGDIDHQGGEKAPP